MNNKIRLPVRLIIFLVFFVFSCANVIETKLKENPEFVKNAEKLKITSPLSYKSTKFNKYIIEDTGTENIYEIEPDVETTGQDIQILEEEKTREKNLIKTKEFTSYRIFLVNPLNNNEYEVIGKTTYFRSKEEKGNSSSESGKMIYPVEFWIFHQGKDAGSIKMDSPGFTKVNAKILFNNKNFDLEYQSVFNKECYSFKENNTLAALILLEPEGTIAFKKKGEILLKKNFSENLKSDIITIYILTATMFNIVGQAGI